MKNLLEDLLQFLDELKAYKEILTNPNSELLEAKRKNELLAAFPFLQDALPKKSKEEVKEEVREKLVLKHSVLKNEIAKLTGRTDIDQFSRTWNRALSPVFGIGENKDALSLCIDYTLEAIGKLKDEIKTGIRDKEGNLIEKSQRTEVPEPFQTYENYGGRIFGDEFEVTVQGTVDMAIECMMHFTKKLNSQGHSYKSSPRIGDHPDYAKPDRTCFATCTITESTEGTEKQIGTIKLRLLPNERTLLKTSPPEEWNSSFKYFLDALFTEFERLGYLKEERPPATAGTTPKAFISHGKESAALHKLKEFIETLGIEPLIVKKQPSLDKTVDDKVNYYLGQADFVIILATGDDEIEGKLHPRQNVIHEIGLAQNTHRGKIIYLLEERAEFPSNIRPKAWEPFNQDNMESVFAYIVKELRALGILKAAKS